VVQELPLGSERVFIKETVTKDTEKVIATFQSLCGSIPVLSNHSATNLLCERFFLTSSSKDGSG
jgi:hypothetical protein